MGSFRWKVFSIHENRREQTDANQHDAIHESMLSYGNPHSWPAVCSHFRSTFNQFVCSHPISRIFIEMCIQYRTNWSFFMFISLLRNERLPSQYFRSHCKVQCRRPNICYFKNDVPCRLDLLQGLLFLYSF